MPALIFDTKKRELSIKLVEDKSFNLILKQRALKDAQCEEEEKEIFVNEFIQNQLERESELFRKTKKVIRATEFRVSQFAMQLDDSSEGDVRKGEVN